MYFLKMSEFIGVAEKDGGLYQLMFCVFFCVQTGGYFQGLKILGDVVRLLDRYRRGISVLGVP